MCKVNNLKNLCRRKTAGRGAAILLGCCLGMTSVVLPSGDVFFRADTVRAVDYAAEFYVSPDGDDNGSGTIDSPFRTLERARDAVREINQNMSGDICVYLRGGT